MQIHKLNTISEKTLFLPKDENGREIYHYFLPHCRFTGDNLFYPNVLVHSEGELYNPVQEKIMSLDALNSVTEFEFQPSTALNIEKSPVFFFLYNTENYYHFVYDSLPYLISFFHLKKQYPTLKLLLTGPNSQQPKLYTFVEEFLSLLGISVSDRLWVDKDTLYQEVFISTSYTHDFDSNLPPRTEIYDLYRSILTTIPSIQDTPSHIYISRRSWIHGDYSNIGTNYTQRRKMENEDALVKIFIDNGYAEVFTENLSTIEKLNYFLHAHTVIGAIGGGICNVVFSPPSTRLIALISPTFLEVNKRFIYSLNQVQVEYFTDTESTEKGKFKTNMRVQTSEGIIGEIEHIYEDRVKIAYTLEKVSGWNSQISFSHKEIPFSDIIPLDQGLNSPWIVNLEKLHAIL